MIMQRKYELEFVKKFQECYKTAHILFSNMRLDLICIFKFKKWKGWSIPGIKDKKLWL